MKKSIFFLLSSLFLGHMTFAQTVEQHLTPQEKKQEQRSLNLSEKINPFSVNVFQGNKPYGTPIEQVLIADKQPVQKVENHSYVSLCLKDQQGNIHNQYNQVQTGIWVQRGKDDEGEYVNIRYTKILQLEKTNIGGCDIENPIIGIREEKVYLPIISFYNASYAIAKNGEKSQNRYAIEIVPFDNLQK